MVVKSLARSWEFREAKKKSQYGTASFLVCVTRRLKNELTKMKESVYRSVYTMLLKFRGSFSNEKYCWFLKYYK